MAMTNITASRRKKSKAIYGAVMITRVVEHAAATRIQAAFRAHLARKALHALRGLVKLQALVRGHLVRKQTTATLRRMHALMAIQVRARFQRIQMAEEPKLAVKSHSSRYGRFPQEVGFQRAQRDPVDINLYGKHAMVKSQNGYMNHSQIKRIEHGITTFYSGELSISKREQKYEEFSFTTHNSPRHSPPMSKTTPGRSSFSSQEFPCMPSYMANTESSRAKLRSQSEPKQRPTLNYKAKGKNTASAEDMNDYDSFQQQYSSKGVADENQEPWFAKVYRSTRAPYDNEGYTSGRTSYSEYRKSLVRDEPHATLF
ncbi:IQ motif, EF-hand binding site [Corchorus olitorius]|uniref:IQ motif, EF-hand binding site n=1 Tax=Corchorus olitorius TaxID=93759 RepID=A0A1R3JNS1_9ROSI|nr:IQ motif, EF-hand binding site [Corchorus olitorius]